MDTNTPSRRDFFKLVAGGTALAGGVTAAEPLWAGGYCPEQASSRPLAKGTTWRHTANGLMETDHWKKMNKGDTCWICYNKPDHAGNTRAIVVEKIADDEYNYLGQTTVENYRACKIAGMTGLQLD